MSVDYKSTLQLPKTDFPMRAELPKREPGFLTRWDAENIFERILANRTGAPIYALHDGPPYANGHIHQGHTLNKILKDMVVKYKTMAGFRVDFVPGWDCHGLPIEREVDKALGPERKAALSKVEFRQACRDYAAEFVAIQRDEFKRLGIFGRWSEPYLTMAPGYEAIIAREFGRFVRNRGAYKGKKPVNWCWNDRTALAEAEVEYEEKESQSVWVKFELPSDVAKAAGAAFAGKKTFVVIWTTTPWTLPANLGISLNPEFDYVALQPDRADGEAWIVAAGLRETFENDVGVKTTVLGVVDAKALDGKSARHPWMDRGSKIMLGSHVTLEGGTGCVHTAPGHGADDFYIGQRYGLEVLVPVDDRGVLTDEAGPFAGEFIYKAEPKIIEHLRSTGHLVAHKAIRHEYPHCWRCKKPVIFRATTQWFISMETNDLRKNALAEIERTTWIPAWGRDRIHGMIANRPDWCISRQRVWGVPIVAFQCEGCGETHTTEAIVERVAKRFDTEGADAWYAHSAKELIGDEKCPSCGKSEWKQENDILDVWFESGVSFAAVCEPRPDLGFPVDLYLEGSDQHRGWFHSTLLASVGTRGKNAYKAALTHGFVVAADGTKMSKSKGNYVALDKVLEQGGADLLRLWVASSDYREDIRLSDAIIKNVTQSYLTIRNNGARAILLNLGGFEPDRHRVRIEAMPEIDRYMLHRLAELIDQMKAAYETFEFHAICQAAVNFCAVELSSFYVDVLKDRLYCEADGGPGRKSAQTVLFEILSALTRALAPILAFTAEETWSALPAWKGKEPSVHMARFPEAPKEWRDPALAQRWKKILEVRSLALKKMEEQRAASEALFKERKALRDKKESATPADRARIAELDGSLLGGAEDARATVAAPQGGDGITRGFLEQGREAVREGLGVSAVDVVDGPVLAVTVDHAPGTQCPRCRRWYPVLGATAVCARCAAAVASQAGLA